MRPLDRLSYPLKKPVTEPLAARLVDPVIHQCDFSRSNLYANAKAAAVATAQSACHGSHSMKFQSAATLAIMTTTAASLITTIDGRVRVLMRITAPGEKVR